MKSIMRNFSMVLLACLVSSCSSDTKETAAGTDFSQGVAHNTEILHSVYDVTYQDDTIIVSDDAMQYFQYASDDLTTLTFRKDAGPLLDLEKGKVTIFPLTALRRVTSWSEEGDSIIVNTEYAALTDAIKDGKIELTAKVSWQPGLRQTKLTSSTQRTWLPPISVFPTAHADDDIDLIDSISMKLPIKSLGLDLGMKLTPETTDKLKFEVTVKASKAFFRKSITRHDALLAYPPRTVNSFNWYGTNTVPDAGRTESDYSSGGAATNAVGGDPDSIPENSRSDAAGEAIFRGGVEALNPQAFGKISGHISGFTPTLRIRIEDSEVKHFLFRIDDLKGEAKLEGASLDSVVGTANLKIPLEIGIPLPVGGMPVELKLGAEFSFRPIVHTGTAKLCFDAKFDANTGVEFRDGNLTNSSAGLNRSLQTCSESETVAAGRITVGMGATAKFPSVSLSLFRDVVVPNVHIHFNGVINYEPGILSAQRACQSGKASVGAIIALKLKLFKILSMDKQAKLWETEKEWTCDKQLVERKFDKETGEKETVSDI